MKLGAMISTAHIEDKLAVVVKVNDEMHSYSGSFNVPASTQASEICTKLLRTISLLQKRAWYQEDEDEQSSPQQK